MKKERKRIPKRLLSFVLSIVLLFGLLPASVFAASDRTAPAEYTVAAYGGTIAYADKEDTFHKTAPADAVLTIRFDESQFPGKTFDCWKSADGTEIPKKTFRLLVKRDTAFYPVFKDVTGNYGEWETFVQGKQCDAPSIQVRSDEKQGLKEYRFVRNGYHNNCRYERIDDKSHRKICLDCSYTETGSHWWDAGVVTTEATHLTDGVKTYTCASCGAKKYEIIEKSGQHTYPSSPKESDYIIDEPAVDGKPGKRHLKCTECGFEQEPSEYLVSSLPGTSGKVQHFTYERTSPYSSGSSLNQARVEEHYSSDHAYYYAVKKATCSYRFEFLWFDHGKHSPVYIKAGTRYGTADSNYYGIVTYADNREEFLKLINSSSLLSTYDNGRHSSMLTSEYSGSRYFEKLWNDEYTRSKLKKIKENVTRPGWKTPLTEYEYNNGSSRHPYLYIDENNVCVFQYVGPGDSMELKCNEELDEFPFSEPERDKITWYSYQVTDGTYEDESWDSLYFGMISEESNEESRTVRPYNAQQGKYFSHWEKYNFDTKKYEYCSDQESWTPSVSDVTKLRAVFKDYYYHIKVNGGYYQISTGWYKWSEPYTEGDVIYGKEIRLSSDSSLIPEGKETDQFIDQNGNKVESYTFTPTADGEYTMTYKEKEMYFSANARNGVVKKDGEAFSGGYFPIGTQITLTTESSDSAAYPYFIGWCQSEYGMNGEQFTILSTEDTYTTTVSDDYDTNRIIAVWSDSPTLPEIMNHNITVVNGFISNEESEYVSDIRVADGNYVRVMQDPTSALKVQSWVVTDTETGTEITRKEANDYGTYFEITSQADDKKGGKPGSGEMAYPANITITGETEVCTEHVWNEGIVTKEPNYVEEGEKTFTCTVCGTKKTEPIEKLDRYCVHACKNCGKCTLPETDKSCKSERCTCDTPQVPILINQNGVVNGTPNGVKLTVVEVEGDSGEAAPYFEYCLKAAEGYEIAHIYDISLTNPDGTEYTLADGEKATVTLKVGKENAQALLDGRMNIIHIAAKGKEIYGVGYKPISVDVENGTVTFDVDSFSPFLLVRSPIEYYGRNALSALSNKEVLLYAYDQIVRGVENSAETIRIYNGTNAITKEELQTVFDAYRRDHTEHFWLGSGYSINYNTDTVLEVMPEYTMSGATLVSAKAAFDKVVSEMLGGITSSMSEYEREKMLHDRLAAQVMYDGSAANAHDAYGALVDGKAVCEGYAKAFQYLLQKAGMQSFLITGSSTNPVSGTAEGHAWNVVRVAGEYYHVDTVWDDQGEHIFYAYFNKTTDAISEDHTIDTTAYALPTCKSEAADYFFVNGGRLPAFDVGAVANLLRNGNGTTRIYVTGDKSEFIAALTAHISEVAVELGYTGGFRYGYENLGREFILSVTPNGVTVSGSILCFGNEADSITAELVKDGETVTEHMAELAGVKNEEGKIELNYSFVGVAAGTYTLRVSKNHHVTREYAVTVGSEPVEQPVVLHLKGDLDGDGKINMKDWNRVYAHINKTELLTEYALQCGDVNGDGTVNMKDWKRIYDHINKTELLW